MQIINNNYNKFFKRTLVDCNLYYKVLNEYDMKSFRIGIRLNNTIKYYRVIIINYSSSIFLTTYLYLREFNG